MIMQFYDCIVCKKSVGCLPDTPREERYCNNHSKEEVENAIKNLPEEKESIVEKIYRKYKESKPKFYFVSVYSHFDEQEIDQDAFKTKKEVQDWLEENDYKNNEEYEIDIREPAPIWDLNEDLKGIVDFTLKYRKDGRKVTE